MRWISPALVPLLLIVLIGAQATRLLAPERGSWVWAVVLAAGGVAAAEVAAASTGLGGPGMGTVHPLADTLGIVLFEVLGATLVGRHPRDGRA